MANDAEVRIEVNPDLNKKLLKSSAYDVAKYIKDSISEAKKFSQSYSDIKGEIDSVTESQSKLSDTISDFRKLVSDVSKSVTSIKGTGLTSFQDAITDAVPVAKELGEELTRYITLFDKVQGPKKYLRFLNSNLDTLKSMRDVITSIQDASTWLGEEWDTGKDKLLAYKEGLGGFVESLNNAKSLKVFNRMTDDLSTLNTAVSEYNNKLYEADKLMNYENIPKFTKPIEYFSQLDTLEPSIEQIKKFEESIRVLTDDIEGNEDKVTDWQGTIQNAFSTFFGEVSRLQNAVDTQSISEYQNMDLKETLAKVKASVSTIKEVLSEGIFDEATLNKSVDEYLSTIDSTIKEVKDDAINAVFNFSTLEGFEKYSDYLKSEFKDILESIHNDLASEIRETGLNTILSFTGKDSIKYTFDLSEEDSELLQKGVKDVLPPAIDYDTGGSVEDVASNIQKSLELATNTQLKLSDIVEDTTSKYKEMHFTTKEFAEELASAFSDVRTQTLELQKKDNLKYIAKLEKQYSEEKRDKEITSLNEVLEAEKKNRAELQASRLAEIKEEADAYKASVAERTKERVSGYLTESDLGASKGTNALSKTKDQISSIREEASERLKGADLYEKKESDIISKLALKRRESAEKEYSDRIHNIDEIEKSNIDSLKASLIKELKNNAEISREERETIINLYREHIASVEKAAELKKVTAKEDYDTALRNSENLEAKELSSLARVTANKKAAIEETKAAEISAVVEGYNRRKAEEAELKALAAEMKASALKDKKEREDAIAHETALVKKGLEEESRLRKRKDEVESRYSYSVGKSKDTYKDTLKSINTRSEQSKVESESQVKIELERELDRIRRSSDDDAVKRDKEREARRLAAEKNNHNTIIRNLEAERSKRLAYLEYSKANELAAERQVHEQEISDIEKKKGTALSAIDEEFYQLESNKDKLSVEEFNRIKRDLLEKKAATEAYYDDVLKREYEYHDKSVRNIETRTKADLRSIELTHTKKVAYENERYAKVTSEGTSPVQSITDIPADGKKEEILKEVREQSQKLLNLFERGVKSVWSNYTKYGKGAIQTVSSLFKTTLQKTFSGSKKINEMMGLSKGTQEVNTFTDALGKLKSQLLGIAGVSISLKTLLGTTEASSELIEMQNVVNTVFGDMSDSVNAFAKSANTSLGLTEFQAKKFTSIFGSMFKTSGVSVESSRLMGENLTALSADLASFFDADFTEAFDKVKSGLAGMIMPLRAYGIDLSVASMQQYMLDKGIQATWKDLSIAEKQMVRYNYMMERTTDMQGDFAKTSGSWANQLRLLKNQVRELAVMVGSFLEMYIYPAIRGLNNFLGVLVKVGRELQKIFHFESKDLLKQQGLSGINKGIAVDTGYAEEESEINDLTSSTDKLTEAKKKLQKQNERQEASFDSLIKLSKQSTDANDAETKGTASKDKGKGKGAGLNLEPIDYGKGLDLSKAPIKLPKWAQRIIKWAREIEGLFSKYGKRIEKKVEEMQEAWSPVSDKLGKAVDWLWGTVLKPFVEWLLKEAIPKTIDLLKSLGGVVDSVMEPIGEVIKGVWESVLEPFFKSIGTKYIKWVEDSTEKLEAWKAKFDSLETVEDKLDFLEESVKNWFEGTIKSIFGEKSDEVLKHFYSSWDSLKGVFDNVFSSSEEMAKGTLFSEEFRTAVENLAGAFGELASNHFSNITGLLKTITDNQVPLSEVAGSLASGFSSIETMVFDGIKTLINTMANNKEGVVGVVDSLTSLVTAVGGAVFSGLNTTLDKLVSSGTASSYITIIKDALVRIAEIAFDNIDSLIDWLGEKDTQETVKSIRDNLIDTFENITNFLQSHKDTLLNLIEVASKFIKFASEHPYVVLTALIGGKLISGLGTAASAVGGVSSAFKILQSVGTVSINALLSPVGLLISTLLLAWGFIEGMNEKFDEHADFISQTTEGYGDTMRSIAELNKSTKVGDSDLVKYQKLLSDVGMTVTSTGDIMTENWGKYNQFATGVQDASKMSGIGFREMKEALVSFGEVTQEEADKMSNQEIMDKLNSSVNIAGGMVMASLRQNTESIKDLTAESAKDISSWTDNVMSKITDTATSKILNSKSEMNYKEWKDIIGKRTAEIAELTGELPARVIEDVKRLITEGASTEDLTNYFDSVITDYEETAKATAVTIDKVTEASTSMQKATKAVQKSADKVNLDEAIKSVLELADAYDDATEASRNMVLTETINSLKDYYTALYETGEITASELSNQIIRLEEYTLAIEGATTGTVDTLREARTKSNEEQALFTEDQIAQFQSLATTFQDSVPGLKEAYIQSFEGLKLTDEQKQYFYDNVFPKMDSAIQLGLERNLQREVSTVKNNAVNASNAEETAKIELETTVPDENSSEAKKAKDKAKEAGKDTAKGVVEGAQKEIDNGELSNETLLENSKKLNGEATGKYGTSAGNMIVTSAQTAVDGSEVLLEKALKNSEKLNGEATSKYGTSAGNIAVTAMQNTVQTSKVNLADSLRVEINESKISYIANSMNNMLLSALSRVQKIDLSSKLTVSGSPRNLPVAYGASTYTTLRTGNIPHLAKGAVIPPRSKFLAVLGDQRSGYNIETPLDTMVDAFKIALQDSGLLNRGDSDQPIQLTVQIGSEKLDDRIINVVDGRNVRSGGL